MQNNPHIFPFGFRAFYAVATQINGRSLGDEDVAECQRMYLSKTDGYTDWAFKRRVINNALRLFGDSFSLWVKQQLGNPYVNEKALRFIDDTIRFILTGKREMMVMHWPRILDANPKSIQLTSGDMRKALDGVIKTNSDSLSKDYLSSWLSHPGGFDDLVFTMSVVFVPDVSQDEANTIRHQSPKNPQLQRLNTLLNG